MRKTALWTSMLWGSFAFAGVGSNIIPIDSVQDLENINQNLAGNYILMQNLDLRGINFIPIGSLQNAFTGSFNGNNHVISDLNLVAPKAYDTGLFAHIGPAGVVSNLRIANANISGWNTTGIIAGESAGKITGVTVTGNVTGYTSTGGIVGANNGGTISNSSAEVTLNPTGDFAGGLTGGNGEGVITHSFAIAVVNDPQGSHVGGLVGDNGTGQITQSYAEGAVSGVDNVGGLSGGNYQGQLENDYAAVTVNATGFFVGGFSGDNVDGASLTNDYSLGHVIGGNQYVGGLVGYNEGQIKNAYWDIDTSGQSTSAGGVGETDSAMQDIATYQDWDFNALWQMQTYPTLRGF